MYNLLKIINRNGNRYNLNIVALNDIEKAFQEFINVKNNVELMALFNDRFGIPPVYFFIISTYLKNQNLFTAKFCGSSKNKNKQRFGKVVGEFFYYLGYKKERSKKIGVVHNASLFSK